MKNFFSKLPLKLTLASGILGIAVLLAVSFAPSGVSAISNIDNIENAGAQNAEAVNAQQLQNSLKTNPIVKDIQKIVDFGSALVGVVVIMMIIVGGIQYAMAGDKAEAVTAAKKRITNALIALVAFMLLYAFLQWLVPGGLFK